MKALEDLVVLDLTHMLSGPYGAMLLSDLGARTIKVEPPNNGEGTRELLANTQEFARQGMGAYFLTLNRGKESICIDLKLETGRAVFYDLVRKADVVIDNFRVGVTKRLGIDHATLSSINPRIVTCSVTGFGETGPNINRPAFDQVVQALGGGMSITGYPDREPVRSGIPIGDLGGGLFGVIGILAALFSRNSSGRGQHVDISMLDAQISLLNYMATMYLMSDIVPERIGNGHFVHVPYNEYKTKTGHIIIACIGDAFYHKFIEVITRPELRKNAYQKQSGRILDRIEIDGVIQEEMLKDSSEYWLNKLNEAGIPCAPVNDFHSALNDPQILSRGMIADVHLQNGEVIKMPGNPIKLSETNDQDYGPPPRLGEHTHDILSGFLNYSEDRIKHLSQSSVIL